MHPVVVHFTVQLPIVLPVGRQVPIVLIRGWFGLRFCLRLGNPFNLLVRFSPTGCDALTFELLLVALPMVEEPYNILHPFLLAFETLLADAARVLGNITRLFLIAAQVIHGPVNIDKTLCLASDRFATDLAKVGRRLPFTRYLTSPRLLALHRSLRRSGLLGRGRFRQRRKLVDRITMRTARGHPRVAIIRPELFATAFALNNNGHERNCINETISGH